MNNQLMFGLIQMNLNEWLLIQVEGAMKLIRLNLDGNEEQKETAFLLRLTFARLWAILGGIGTLVAGGYALGILHQSYATEQKNIELAQARADIDRLEKTCPVQRAKETLFALQSRILITKDKAARLPSNKKLQKEVKDAEKQLAMFLDENVDQKLDKSASAIMRVVVDNEDSEDSKIQLRGELETFEVSPDVKKLTKNIIWNNPPQENAPGILKAVLRQQRESAELLDRSSNRQLCPLKKKSSLPTQQTGILEIRKFYPAMIHPQP